MNVPIQTREEFKRFFKEYFPAVRAFLTRYAKDEELARDLAQETFIKVYEHREDIRDIEHAKAFLYTVARRLYRDHCKHALARERFVASEEEAGEAWEDHEFLREITRQETLRVLRAAIDKLPPRARQVMIASLQGKNSTEVAREMNITPSTVKSLKKSALLSLRSMLSKDQLFLLLLLIGE
ncbi:MAG: sigma-70 family RNA polymerase sigma factor [Odoribacteraceae bacterium]|jgi:RNA polymerase sigma-70 factor (ECF subfamily)|nr:sigma-70 family RNA polymerase sigma factor [Odoribacteraceae bacterium]